MIDLVMRYSELAVLMDCQLKYKIEYASGLKTPPGRRLVLGSAYHALMQGHYEAFRNADIQKRPRDLMEARQSAARRLQEYMHGEGHEHIDDEMLDQLRWMYAGYVERWGTEPDLDRFLIIEQQRIVPLVRHRGVRVSLRVTADLIGHHRVFDRYLLIDHKTASGRDASKDVVAKENDLDSQRALYSASYSDQGLKKGRIPIFGAYHNVVRTDKLKREMSSEERFARTPVFYNDIARATAWAEAKEVARHAVEIRLGKERLFYSSPDPLQCGWKCAHLSAHLTARATGRDPVQVAIDYGAVRDADFYPMYSPRKAEVTPQTE